VGAPEKKRPMEAAKQKALGSEVGVEGTGGVTSVGEAEKGRSGKEETFQRGIKCSSYRGKTGNFSLGIKKKKVEMKTTHVNIESSRHT